MIEHPATRLFVDPALNADATITLDSDRTHYLRHVLRLEIGATLALFNGRDGEWLARLSHATKAAITLTVSHPLRAPAPESDLWLLFAPIKGQRIDSIAEKATELGASVLWPVFTRRTEASRVNVARLRANAREAAEQCERLTVPEVRDPEPLERVLAAWPAARPLLWCAEAGPADPIGVAAARIAPGPAAFLVGPEGGFDHSELDALAKLPFVVAVGLGPRVLRADTAVFAALACWQAIKGDWTAMGATGRPPFRADPDHATSR
ncbi:MAG: 16S rRNA (uracil(1498)-N(3))-methyltransferase [Azospirillaceae bacterium]|nr:16S rRNA (uracil(1498)-N(3))-methyltransferase [Azospirillaceae bacterium]